MLIAACYVRVSTDDQLEYSPDSQVKIIMDYAKKHDMLLPEEFIFREDDGISGRKADKRPEFQRMVSEAKMKPTPFEVILVWKFSRFARNQEESIVYKSLLRREGVEVISVSEPLIEGPFGGLIERIIEWMDEYYSTNLGGEVKRGMRERLSRGLPTNAAPYGYVWKDGRFEIEPEAAAIIRQMFERYAAGEPVLQITKWANTLGTGRVWENRTIEYIVRNPVYIGKLRSGTSVNGGRDYYGEQVEVCDGQHEAIIPLELWEAVQERVSRRRRQARKHDHTANAKPRLYNGILRCSACGSTLASGGKANFWQCVRYNHGQCTVSHFTTTEAITAAVLPAIARSFESGDFITSLAVTNQREEAQQETVRRQVEQAKTRLKRVQEAYEAGVYTLDEFKESRNRIQADIESLTASLQPSSQDPEQIKKDFIDRNRKYLDVVMDATATDAERNAALKNFVSKIVFHRAENRYDIFYYL